MNYARQQWLILLALLFLIMSAVNSWAVPQTVNYQGMLTDSSGDPVSATGLAMEFILYTAPSGGAVLWSETQSVDVIDGVFNVQLGTVTPFPTGLFEDDTYLGITVGTGTEMTPRHSLVSVPYALTSEDADSLGGYAADAFSLTGHAHNDLYYTKSEITVLLGGKANTAHNHSGSDITSGTVAEPYIDGNITRDGELSSGLAGKADTVHVHSGDDITSGTVADARIAASIARDSEIMSTVLAGDGSGSGLDADQLDGHDTAYFATATTVTVLQNQVATLQSQVDTLVTLLANVTRNSNDITFSGVNVHIVNGTGATYTANGLGNLIVGYNEPRGSGDVRSGSHNIVTGSRQNFSSWGGLIAGYNNTISDDYATVTGGIENTASGLYSHVSGGRNNKASGILSSVVGGGSDNALYGNEAFGNYSAVLGGIYNIAGDPDRVDHGIGQQSTVSGGDTNRASGTYASVTGGKNNTASGDASSASGGWNNKASGNYAAVLGGGSDNALYGNEAFAHYSAILGGIYNLAGDPQRVDPTIGQRSTVAGGDTNNSSGIAATVSGGKLNIAEGNNSAIGGGYQNQAVTDYSSVGGGFENIANNGWYATISGARPNYDSGWVTIDRGMNTLVHNLGGDTDNYVVDLQFNNIVSPWWGVHQRGYGGYEWYSFAGGGSYPEGAYWHNLTNSSIDIYRNNLDDSVDYCRVRIWVNN